MFSNFFSHCETLKELIKEVSKLEDLPLGLSLTRRECGGLGRELVWCNDAYAAFAGRDVSELMEIGDMRLIQARVHCPGQSRLFQRKVELGRHYKGRYFWIKHDGLHLAMTFSSWPIETVDGIFVLGVDKPLPHEEAEGSCPGSFLSEKADGRYFN
jgi:PAS domain-containing protein